MHFVRWRLGLAPAEPQTTEAERACLARLARGRRRIVEIGVWHGVTTAQLRQAMAPDGVLIAVDPFPRGRLGVSFQRAIARVQVDRVRVGSVRWLRMTGVDAARAYAVSGGAPVDFAFIDAEHSYEGLRDDWEAWSGLVAEGGVVALHDSRSSAQRSIDDVGSVIFTNTVIVRDPRFDVIERVDSLTVLVRRPDSR